MATRSTECKLFTENCPGAVLLHRGGAVQDRSIFQPGTVAHEVLEGLTSGVPWEDIATRLLTAGRGGRDAEPPIPEAAVHEGLALARGWVETHGTPAGSPEVLLGVDAAGRAAVDGALISGPIDLVYFDFEPGYEGEEIEIACGRDYKSSWRAGEDDLDSFQRRLHAVLLWAAYPECGAVRVEVAALRTKQVHVRTFYRGADDERIAQWMEEIRVVASAIERGPLEFSPGVGCVGCGYASHCDAAWSVVRDEDADPVHRWAVASAVAEACKPLAQAATKEAPAPIPGGFVGYAARASRVPSEDAAEVITTAWESRFGEMDRGGAEALIGNLGLSVKAIEAVGKVLYKGRDRAAARREWVAKIVNDKIGTVWGPHKGEEG